MPPMNVKEHLSVWENPPVAPDEFPLNPEYSQCDLRAIAEKRRRCGEEEASECTDHNGIYLN